MADNFESKSNNFSFVSESIEQNFISDDKEYSFRTRPKGDCQIGDIWILDENGYGITGEQTGGLFEE